MSAAAHPLRRAARRVLSVQSHTVHGYVGNKSAVFPLQLLGFEVDPINSVQFSNHTGCSGGFRGEVLHGDQLWDLVEGLETNGLLRQYTHLLTGYIGSVTFLRTVIRTVRLLREKDPTLRYHCDPVMGDDASAATRSSDDESPDAFSKLRRAGSTCRASW